MKLTGFTLQGFTGFDPYGYTNLELHLEFWVQMHLKSESDIQPKDVCFTVSTV